MKTYLGEKFYQDCNECEKPIHYGFFAWYPDIEQGQHLCPECAKGQQGRSYPVRFSFSNYRRQAQRHYED